MKRNVYDFDKTVCRGDSTAAFCLFCLVRRPAVIIDYARALPYFIRMARGRITKTEAKAALYRFIRRLGDSEALVRDFWKHNTWRIKDWYLKQKDETDLIISASPEFTLRPITDALGVTLIGSLVDPISGESLSLNCHGEEKVRRMREQFPDTEIVKFYSDAYSDTPLARLAEKAYLVRGDRIMPFFRGSRSPDAKDARNERV